MGCVFDAQIWITGRTFAISLHISTESSVVAGIVCPSRNLDVTKGDVGA